MKSLSLVMPYYENPGMLAAQYALWREYPQDLKEHLEILVVDDGSPEGPAVDVARPEGLPKLCIYRVLEDRPWHQHAARNLGAKMATGQWLLMTDMDHMVPSGTLKILMAQINKARVYLFPRLDAPHLTPTMGRDGYPKPHPNTFALTRALYWEVGGYDEEFCGIYGTDGLFRARLFANTVGVMLTNAPIIRYPREVIADASTRTLPRKEGREPGEKRAILDRKTAQGRANQITTLNFPWTQVL